MSHRNSGVSRTRNRRCDSGNDFKCDSRVDNRLRFLRAATEYERIPAFQAHDLVPCPRPAEHLRVREVVVNDYVCALDAFLRAQRDQSKIAGPGADKINFAALALTHALIFSSNSAANFSASSLGPPTIPSRGAVAPRSKICPRTVMFLPSISAKTPTG